MDKVTITPFIPMIKVFEMEFFSEISKHLSQHKVTEILNKAYEMFLDTVPLIPDVDNKSPWLKNIIGVAYEIGV